MHLRIRHGKGGADHVGITSVKSGICRGQLAVIVLTNNYGSPRHVGMAVFFREYELPEEARCDEEIVAAYRVGHIDTEQVVLVPLSKILEISQDRRPECAAVSAKARALLLIQSGRYSYLE